VSDRVAALRRDGLLVCRGLLDTREAARLGELADRRYAAVAGLRAQGARYLPHASSLELEALEPGAVARLEETLAGSLRGAIQACVGSAARCSPETAWLRRQYAPARAPRHHRPHSWHQDGALGCALPQRANASATRAPRRMLTCWIALTPCGRDAPGLSLVARPQHQLLAVEELDDAGLRARFAGHDFRHPRLAAGDALLFPGGTLHRTHVTPAMTRDRTSIEVRFG